MELILRLQAVVVASSAISWLGFTASGYSSVVHHMTRLLPCQFHYYPSIQSPALPDFERFRQSRRLFHLSTSLLSLKRIYRFHFESLAVNLNDQFLPHHYHHHHRRLADLKFSNHHRLKYRLHRSSTTNPVHPIQYVLPYNPLLQYYCNLKLKRYQFDDFTLDDDSVLLTFCVVWFAIDLATKFFSLNDFITATSELVSLSATVTTKFPSLLCFFFAAFLAGFLFSLELSAPLEDDVAIAMLGIVPPVLSLLQDCLEIMLLLCLLGGEEVFGLFRNLLSGAVRLAEREEALLTSEPALGERSKPWVTSSDSVPELGVRDLRGSLLADVLDELVLALVHLARYSFFGTTGGLLALALKFSTEDCREFNFSALGGDTISIRRLRCALLVPGGLGDVARFTTVIVINISFSSSSSCEASVSSCSSISASSLQSLLDVGGGSTSTSVSLDLRLLESFVLLSVRALMSLEDRYDIDLSGTLGTEALTTLFALLAASWPIAKRNLNLVPQYLQQHSKLDLKFHNGKDSRGRIEAVNSNSLRHYVKNSNDRDDGDDNNNKNDSSSSISNNLFKCKDPAVSRRVQNRTIMQN
uniref:Uncharacterized protein n=1 Tax=Glossina palpalis gambiensis TaxID=67801 RepID=A0A1B0ANQ1_9MUSC